MLRWTQTLRNRAIFGLYAIARLILCPGLVHVLLVYYTSQVSSSSCVLGNSFAAAQRRFLIDQFKFGRFI